MQEFRMLPQWRQFFSSKEVRNEFGSQLPQGASMPGCTVIPTAAAQPFLPRGILARWAA
jgi:hypothetical protein